MNDLILIPSSTDITRDMYCAAPHGRGLRPRATRMRWRSGDPMLETRWVGLCEHHVARLSCVLCDMQGDAKDADGACKDRAACLDRARARAHWRNRRAQELD